ncbi:unnamed protein product [Rhizophagus irregularis]|nr:unnamed protein product [Rhizophagus irregularis]
MTKPKLDTGSNGGNNFTDLFKGYFANDTRKNKWYQELLTLRQGSNETVDDYAAKFQRLLKRVDTDNKDVNHNCNYKT